VYRTTFCAEAYEPAKSTATEMRKRTSPPVGLDIINIPTEAKLGFSATAGSSAVCNFANARSTLRDVSV
jgi:hypothetical protein